CSDLRKPNPSVAGAIAAAAPQGSVTIVTIGHHDGHVRVLNSMNLAPGFRRCADQLEVSDGVRGKKRYV
ncbi:uncharacterized protein PITG_21737, partial [Phytophthora infestans T30-4]